MEQRRRRLETVPAHDGEKRQETSTVAWFALATAAFVTGLVVLAWQLNEARSEAGRLAGERQMAWDFADSVLGELSETRTGLTEITAERNTLSEALEVAGETRSKLYGELEDTRQQQKALARAASEDVQQWNRYSQTLKLNLDTESSQRVLAEHAVVKLEDKTAKLSQAEWEERQARLNAEGRIQEAVQANRSLAHEAAGLQQGVQQLRSENANLCADNHRLQSCLQQTELRARNAESLNSQLQCEADRLRACVCNLESKVRTLECEVARLRGKEK